MSNVVIDDSTALNDVLLSVTRCLLTPFILLVRLSPQTGMLVFLRALSRFIVKTAYLRPTKEIAAVSSTQRLAWIA